MIFLIEYDRPEGRIVTFRVFEDSQRSEAEKSRLEIELKNNRSEIDHEVVLLEAASEEALRQTHRRYFEDFSEALDTALSVRLGPAAQAPARTSPSRRLK